MPFLSKILKCHAEKGSNVLWAVIENVESLGYQIEYVGCTKSIRTLD